MSLIRSLSLRSGRRYQPSYSYLTIPLQSRPGEDAKPQIPSSRSYHSLLVHHSSFNGRLPSPNVPTFQSSPIAYYRSFSTSTGAVFDTVGVLVSKAYVFHNVADALASLQHLITFLNSLTFPHWWVCIIVISLLIRGISVPVIIHLLKTIANFFKTLGSQDEVLHKGSLVGKIPRVMYTMLEKEYLGVKGSIIGDGIQVPVFWFSMEQLKQNMYEILLSSLRGKTLSAELFKNRVLSKGRLVVVVGDGFGLELQMFDLDFSLIMRRRRQVSLCY